MGDKKKTILVERQRLYEWLTERGHIPIEVLSEKVTNDYYNNYIYESTFKLEKDIKAYYNHLEEVNNARFNGA